MKLETTLFAAIALAAGLVSGTAAASNYPPSYPLCSYSETHTTGPFEVIRRNIDVWDKHVGLTIAYDGYLRDYYPDNEINFYIKINGNDEFVAAGAGVNDDAYAYFDSGPRACVWCVPNYAGNSSACDGLTYPEYSSGQWVCGGMNAVEQSLFYWGWDQSGQQNAWDIEVAAESHGNWDSNYGNNFYTRFEPNNTCW